MKVLKFKEGESIPTGSKYLYSLVLKENVKTYTPTCDCHYLMKCTCEDYQTWDNVRYNYYEVEDERGVDQFYVLLKSSVTGQVINGVLVGCLLQSELEDIYAEFTKR